MLFSLPVFMYHSISRFKHRLCVSPELFEDQCRVLADAGWRGVSLEEAEHYCLRKGRLPARSLLFTFDDGYLDNYVHAEPILRQYGHKGVIFTVVGLIDTKELLRPQREDGAGASEVKSFAELDSRDPKIRDTGYRVSPIVFCSWKELSAMREGGVMGLAPHSMRHNRVTVDLQFSRLYLPNNRYSFFDVSPEKAVWGMPRFRLGHGLANRGYKIAPELVELVRNFVPQERKEAQAFLSNKENAARLMEAIRRLPVLGWLESEAEYRKRITEDFQLCREEYEKRLGVTPISFCWPWGSYNKIALQEARKVGFKVFFSTMRGVNLYGSARSVRRIAVRGGSGEELLQKSIQASSFFHEVPFELYKVGKPLLSLIKK